MLYRVSYRLTTNILYQDYFQGMSEAWITSGTP